jgi:hypothetical protein
MLALRFQGGGAYAISECEKRNTQLKKEMIQKQLEAAKNMQVVCNAQNVCRLQSSLPATIQLKNCQVYAERGNQGNAEKFKVFSNARDQAAVLAESAMAQHD